MRRIDIVESRMIIRNQGPDAIVAVGIQEIRQIPQDIRVEIVIFGVQLITGDSAKGGGRRRKERTRLIQPLFEAAALITQTDTEIGREPFSEGDFIRGSRHQVQALAEALFKKHIDTTAHLDEDVVFPTAEDRSRNSGRIGITLEVVDLGQVDGRTHHRVEGDIGSAIFAAARNRVVNEGGTKVHIQARSPPDAETVDETEAHHIGALVRLIIARQIRTHHAHMRVRNQAPHTITVVAEGLGRIPEEIRVYISVIERVDVIGLAVFVFHKFHIQALARLQGTKFVTVALITQPDGRPGGEPLTDGNIQ